MAPLIVIGISFEIIIFVNDDREVLIGVEQGRLDGLRSPVE